jgi:H+/gluconate symporter-like permease
MGRAMAMPTIIGSATLAFEIAAACVSRPLMWRVSTSSPIRNM